MMVYLTELTKYFILFLMILYVLECVLYFFKRQEKRRSGIYIRQCIYIFLIQFFAYLSLCLRTGSIDYLFFYAFLQIVIFSMIVLFHMIYPGIDRCLLNNMALLLSIGFIILTRLDFQKALKQFGIVIVSIAISMAVPFVIRRFPNICKWKWIYSATGILALGLVLILGQVTHGSKISYTIAGITLQPSEFVKIIYVFAIASILYESATLKNVMISGVIAAIHVIILVLSKDLGSALIFFVGYLFILFIASGNYLYMLLGLGGGSAAAVVSYHLFRHVQVRVQAFLDPFTVIDKEGFQISQSLFAIACGSWFGTGLLKGVPSDIPYVESDFIFSAISEEMGVLFAIGMLLVCLSCFLIFLRTAGCLKNQFYRLVASGLGVMYLFQVFLTVGGGIKFIPLTGVTLPFVSYGGSSILSSLLIFAVMQGIMLIRKEEIAPTEEDENEEFEEIE
ncbi:MAG: FtsW/RodA/SpoVE family cell cycle protein [Lachnospiraceae bacterium]|nr:FtsW/RodA/SpoVE family cell cycle protein [Lachnospiraceae bacterium]